VLALALTFGSVSPSMTPAYASAHRQHIDGLATWYRYHPGQAAAGAALRRAIGLDWRGTVVAVTANGRTIRVRLTDSMGKTSRLIDLDSDSFRQLAPLSQGVLRVVVTWGEAIPLPATDTVAPRRTHGWWLLS
jgi:hypothetical protein